MWPGAETGQRYPFGGDRRDGNVDIRDGLKFLTQRVGDGAERIWRLYRAKGDRAETGEGGNGGVPPGAEEGRAGDPQGSELHGEAGGDQDVPGGRGGQAVQHEREGVGTQDHVSVEVQLQG